MVFSAWHRRIRTLQKTMYLSEINIYPIKSLRGIPLKEARIEARGLQYDRRWMLVDQNNKFMTQRELPKMATLAVEVGETGLTVTRGKNDCISILPEPPGQETARVRIWKNVCQARVYEPGVNEWFSDILHKKCRLVFMPEETRRKAHHPYKIHADDIVSFADGYPFLLIGEGSLADINSRLEAAVEMRRFRPNFVVAGTEAFAEDNWKKFRIGRNIFYGVKLCGRCVITTVDPDLGVKGKEPLRTLASYRTAKLGSKMKIRFGQNLIAEKPGGVIRVGDKVEVIEEK
jgi:uncharacterized protein YcbX